MSQPKPRSKRWARVYAAAANDRRLTLRDIRVLIALSAHANRDGRCWPKRQSIADMTGLPLRHISTATSRLARFGYIQKAGDGGRKMPCDYWLLDPENPPTSGTVSAQKQGPLPNRVSDPPESPKTVPPAVRRFQQSIYREGSARKPEPCRVEVLLPLGEGSDWLIEPPSAKHLSRTRGKAWPRGKTQDTGTSGVGDV